MAAEIRRTSARDRFLGNVNFSGFTHQNRLKDYPHEIFRAYNLVYRNPSAMK